jgi:outer membrane protein TolC
MRKESLAMNKPNWLAKVVLVLAVPLLAVASGSPLSAQSPPADNGSPPVLRLTLEEMKQRVLADSKLLQLAARNVQSKDYATKAAKALYFPQVIGNSVYFHFNDNLGTVITTPGLKLTGPRGSPINLLTAKNIAVPLFDQNSEYSTINVVQPLTDLLKVRQGVKIARADEGSWACHRRPGARWPA